MTAHEKLESASPAYAEFARQFRASDLDDPAYWLPAFADWLGSYHPAEVLSRWTVDWLWDEWERWNS